MAATASHLRLQTYLPVDRLISLTSGKPISDRAEGAVLFVDVAGFTPLGENMVREFGQQRGAEELRNWLDGLFTTMIEQVHAHHGSVISFLGDAIMCWFDKTVQKQAEGCALAIQHCFEGEDDSSPEKGSTKSRPRVRVAVCAGKARRFVIGAPHIQRLDILAGSILDRVSAASSLASQGEVILGQELLNHLGLKSTFTKWKKLQSGESFAVAGGLEYQISSYPWQEPDVPAAPLSDQWLPREVWRKITSGIGAELRLATVFFMGFDGIRYDADPAAGEKLDELVVRVQSIVNRYEGLTLQVVVGDKGSYIFGAFGLVVSHEDDTVRCVEAAVRFLSLPNSVPHIDSVFVGLNRGLVYSGDYGSPNRRTYCALGSPINIAARLMEMANPDQILFTETIEQQLPPHMSYQPLGNKTIKGLKQPLNLFRLSPNQRRPSIPVLPARRAERILGRQAEAALLRDQINRLVSTNQGSCTLIEGEAGLGKSRLVAETEWIAQEAGVHVLMGEADSIEQSTPYLAWRMVFASILGYDPRSEKTWDIAALTRLTDDPFILDNSPLLNVVLPHACLLKRQPIEIASV
jgi:class 3 adenylate cyclase